MPQSTSMHASHVLLVDAHYLFGLMLERMGHAEKSWRYYRRALQLYAERSFAQGHAARPHSIPSIPAA